MQVVDGCFRELRIKEEYRTGAADVVRDFYIPLLSVAATYDRAVGYFTSDGLSLAAQGLGAFAVRDGRLRLVASPQLTEGDVAAIEQGLEARESVVERRLLQVLRDGAVKSSAMELAWLVAEGRLDLRVAVPTAGSGIYHEKAGVLLDADGCQVAFTGSSNETVGGLISNFESIDVFLSWDHNASRVERKAENFERLWENRTPGLSVMDLPTAVAKELVLIGERSPRPPQPPAVGRTVFNRPPAFEPRSYQTAAVEAWQRNGGRGILSMATGTGKTKTALTAAQRLSESLYRPLILVVVAPYVHLVDQWAEECARWGLRAVRCYESSRQWRDRAWEALDSYRAGATRPLCFITTTTTATLKPFEGLLARVDPESALLVADEVHHLGAEKGATLLSDRFKYRLGLSATPSRWKDEAGTERLLEYFAGIVFEFSIGDAIANGDLCPYVYHPILVELANDELEQYREVIEELEDARARGNPSPEVIAALLARRSAVLNEASGKMDKLSAEVAARPPDHSLFYCASRLQLGAVSDILREAGVAPRAFTAEEDRHERAGLLAAFDSGSLPALVAMNALDEGVDIPTTREAHILASSGNPRQFVQRRGRVLRTHPGKSHARIVDYVVVPEGAGEYDRDLIAREMRRVLDFTETAMNADQARQSVFSILDRYELLHIVGAG